MEQVKLIKNCFKSPVSRSEGLDFSDDVVHVFELHELVKVGPSGEAEDFVVEKKPVEVDCYHLNKVIAERAKGCDLKSIISRVQSTGDISLLSQREVVYGDGFKQPDNLSDAMEEGRKTSAYLDSLSDDEKSKLMKLAKMSDEEFAAYIKERVDAVTSSKIEKVEIKEEVVNG